MNISQRLYDHIAFLIIIFFSGLNRYLYQNVTLSSFLFHLELKVRFSRRNYESMLVFFAISPKGSVVLGLANLGFAR